MADLRQTSRAVKDDMLLCGSNSIHVSSASGDVERTDGRQY